MGPMTNKIVAVLFLARDLAHREHLKTNSYAQHMALGAFYPAIIDLADRLAEACQGRHGPLQDIPLLSNDTGKTNIVEVLQSLLVKVEKMRSEIGEDSSLQAIVDDIVELFLSTIYKLRFLK